MISKTSLASFLEAEKTPFSLDISTEGIEGVFFTSGLVLVMSKLQKVHTKFQEEHRVYVKEITLRLLKNDRWYYSICKVINYEGVNPTTESTEDPSTDFITWGTIFTNKLEDSCAGGSYCFNIMKAIHRFHPRPGSLMDSKYSQDDMFNFRVEFFDKLINPSEVVAPSPEEGLAKFLCLSEKVR